jgi:hypothetical protein
VVFVEFDHTTDDDHPTLPLLRIIEEWGDRTEDHGGENRVLPVSLLDY